MPTIELRFADDERVSFPVSETTTVLEGGEAAGLTLASDCRNGICRTCVAQDAAGNDVLLCNLQVNTDQRITLPYSRAEVMRPVKRRAKIVSLERISPAVWHLRCRLQFPLRFLPGQYVRIAVPGATETRSFSMANPPEDGIFEFYIRALPTGLMSDYLNGRAKVDDVLIIEGPYGSFYLRNRSGPKLFIAGGTGLAPMMSMLTGLARRPAHDPMHLVVGVTQSADAFGQDYMQEMSQRTGLTVTQAAMSLDAAWTGIAGTAIDALAEGNFVATNPEADIYVCGPPKMTELALDWLQQRGCSPKRIFFEAFSPN